MDGYHATYAHATRYLKAALPDEGAATATAVLTFPVLDREGDFVRPDGADWAGARPPLVDWWHQVPVGTGSVRMKAVTIEGAEHVLPVGTTTFFETARDLRGLDLKGYPDRDCLDAAERVAEMVAGGAVNGVSLEFEPAGPLGAREGEGAYWVIGKSLNRPAYNFHRWKGRGWAHAPESAHVNPGALVLAKSLPPAFAEVVRTGEFGGKRLPAVITKAFPQLTDPRRATVRGGYDPEAAMRKAAPNPLDDEDDPYLTDPETPGDDPAMGAEEDPTADMPNEVKHSHDAAQALSDVAGMLMGNAKRIVDKPTRKKWLKIAQQCRAGASLLSDHADTLHAGMGEDMPDDGMGDDPMAGPEDDADGMGDDEDSDLDADDDSDAAPVAEGDDDAGDESDDDKKKPPFGKAVKPARLTESGVIITKCGYVPARMLRAPVRLKSSQLRDVAPPAPVPEPAVDPETLAELRRERKRLKAVAREVRDLGGIN